MAFNCPQCSCSFTTITSAEIYLTKTILQELPESFEVPMDELPRSHRGEKKWRCLEVGDEPMTILSHRASLQVLVSSQENAHD